MSSSVLTTPVAERHEPAVQPARRGLSPFRTALAAGGLSLLVITVVLRLWERSLSLPLAYREDALSHAMHVKGIIERGWYYDNPALGAPFGQQYFDFPLGGEHFQLGILKLLGLVLGDTFLTVNVYYLLTFALIAVGGSLFLRWLGTRPDTAVVFGTLFAFLPYHFARGSRHLFLSGYYVVPLGLYLILAILLGKPLLEPRPGRDHGSVVLRFASGRTVVTLLGCVVLGSTSTYYTVFTALLVIVAAAARALTTRSRRHLGAVAAVVLTMLGALAVNNAPVVLFRQSHGTNLQVAQRNPGEAEYYGLKISQLVLPAEGHRIGALADAANQYRTTSPIPSEKGQALGLMGTLGFLGLLWVAARRLLGRPRATGDALYGPLTFVVLAAVGIATVGGGSALLSSFVSSQIRSWNRLSLFVALASLAATAAFVDRHRARVPERHRKVVAAGLAALFVVGVLDQVPTGQLPEFQTIAAEYRSDRDFVRSIEATLPRGAMVFQLPYRPFPEVGPLERSIDYDHFRGYLHSSRLRWSYGGVKGREADWQEQLRGQPEELLADRLAAVGFAGIWVDRFAYADEARGLEGALAARLGRPALVSRNERYSYFSLEPVSAELRIRLAGSDLGLFADSTLHPVRSRAGIGFGPLQEANDDWWLDASVHSAFDVENPTAGSRDVVVDLALQAAGPEAHTVEVRYPDGSSVRQPIDRLGIRLQRTVTVGPGRSTIDLTLLDTGPLSPDATPLRVFRPAIYDAPPSGL